MINCFSMNVWHAMMDATECHLRYFAARLMYTCIPHYVSEKSYECSIPEMFIVKADGCVRSMTYIYDITEQCVLHNLLLYPYMCDC